MIETYTEYSKIVPLYAGSLPLRLDEVLHHASIPFYSYSTHNRDSSFGYINLYSFLIKTNYPREVLRDMDIAVENKPVQSISCFDVYADEDSLYFNLKGSRMDCTKIYLDQDHNQVPIRYVSYIKLGDYQWGSYLSQ